MNDVLKFEGRDVRMVSRNGEPWWVAKDVCDVLEIGNSRDAIARLDDDEKGVGSIDTLGGTQEMTMVNESGLYSLIIGSRKPESKRFKRWITHEVLPSIRRTGVYAVDPAPKDEFTILREMIDVLESNRKRITSLEGNVGTIETTVLALRDTVDLFGADTDYRTVRAYLRGAKINMPLKDASSVGKKAAALCRDRGILIGDVADERHGSVHSYPIDVLDEAVAFVQSRPKRETAKRSRN